MGSGAEHHTNGITAVSTAKPLANSLERLTVAWGPSAVKAFNSQSMTVCCRDAQLLALTLLRELVWISQRGAECASDIGTQPSVGLDDADMFLVSGLHPTIDLAQSSLA